MSIRTGRVGRRGFLGRALLVGGTGALGTVVGSAGTTAAAQAAPPPPPPRDLVRLGLLGEGWHVLGDAGALPEPGATPLTAGTLTGERGSAVGEFRSARLGNTALLHQFEFPDGTVFGLGQGGLSEADFAVVGGTGHYAGMTGAYTARQQPSELGGAGIATFELSIGFASTSPSVLRALTSSSSAGS